MHRPYLFGILNITVDSFSDGGRYLDPQAALARAKTLVESGADALDIGAAASNPNSATVPPRLEIERMAPVVRAAREHGWKLSIDSFAAETQAWALGQDVAYVNDIQGFADQALYPTLASSRSKLIVMHAVQARGKAQRIDSDPATIMGRIADFFEARLAAFASAGIARERVILDPGMGLFLGTRPEVSLTVLRRLPQLKAVFGLPILVSVSRKSFLRKLADRMPAESGPASLAAELYAALHGADMIRTHEPQPLRDALTIWSHIESGRF